MMPDVFVVSDNIFSPLGKTTAENFAQLKSGNSGIRLYKNSFSESPYHAALFDDGIETGNGNKELRPVRFPPLGGGREGFSHHAITNIPLPASSQSAAPLSGEGIKKNIIQLFDARYTKFEQLLISSIKEALTGCNIDPKDKRALLIISTTKGNISLLENSDYNPELKKRIALPASAHIVAEYFGFVNQPVVISNACISGIMAIITGKRLIQSGQYDHVVVAGADVISKFVLSGFQAFQAVSPQPCRPFDANRNGITLGEGAATVILSKISASNIKVIGGSVSNDANHLSAPSRTGEELAQAIKNTLDEGGAIAADVNFISAHGTATVYNDEMEAKAITLAGLQKVPLNSLKGHCGHTLGAAGLIESVVSMQSIREGVLIPTLGYSQQGTTDSLNIYKGNLPGNYHNCLKIASGFGGCNAAVLFTTK
jgi:3-oxoacyl-[acyl-carrier-protein] synthase-1